MSETSETASGLRPDGTYEFPHPGWPGMSRLKVSRLLPADLGRPDGMCAVVIDAWTMTAAQAEAFREAVYELARSSATCGQPLGGVQGAGPVRCGRPQGHEMHVGSLAWME